jgi:plastocyanin
VDRRKILTGIEDTMQNRLAVAAAYAFTMGLIVAAQAATTMTVNQHGLMLSKSSATLARGDKIVFTNEDDVIHNIHIFGPGDFEKDLGLQKPGGTLSYVFDKTGSVRVRCNIHPSVKMTVTVN